MNPWKPEARKPATGTRVAPDGRPIGLVVYRYCRVAAAQRGAK